MVVVEELVRSSISLGTWPVLMREECDPSLIAKRINAHDASDSIKRGMVSAIESGLIVPTDNRKSISFDDKYFALVGVDEIASILKICSKNGVCPSGLIFQNGDADALGIPLDKKTRKKGSGGRPRKATPEEIELFHVWRKGLGKNIRAVLDKKRLKSIRAALRLGFTFDDLKRSVEGWVDECKSDAWRMEKANRHEISLFLRDAAHVEEGISYTDSKRTEQRMSEVGMAEMESRKRREAALREQN